MPARGFRKLVYAGIVIVALLTTAFAQTRPRARTSIAIPTNTLLQIIRAEDQRRWDDSLRSLLSSKDPKVRKRAALAAGRIGDEGAVLPLIDLLKKDTDWGAQQMAAFALGEIESAKATDALIEATRISDLRARALEALGKIAAALPPTEEQRRQAIGQVVLDALVIERKEAGMTAGGVRDLGVELFGLTAVLRARPTGAGKVVALYLASPDPRVRAAALNTLARLRLKDGDDQARHMLDHSNPIVRANAARVLGATEDKGALDVLLDRALHDDDLRVRVSAIRSLGSLKDKRAAESLVTRGNSLIHLERSVPSSRNELLEISTTLGRILPNTVNVGAVAFLEKLHNLTRGEAVEVEVAFARMVPGIFQNDRFKSELTRPNVTWRQVSRRAQGLAAIKDAISGAATNSAGDHALKDAQKELADMLRNSGAPAFALPDILQAYSSFKPADISELARSQLGVSDVILRSTAAEILGNQPPSEANTKTLAEALPRALRDRDLNDAALAILDALAKQKNEEANDAIKTGLDSSDHLIRRRAVALLKANGVGDVSDRIGTAKTRNTESDYHRGIRSIGR